MPKTIIGYNSDNEFKLISALDKAIGYINSQPQKYDSLSDTKYSNPLLVALMDIKTNIKLLKLEMFNEDLIDLIHSFEDNSIDFTDIKVFWKKFDNFLVNETNYYYLMVGTTNVYDEDDNEDYENDDLEDELFEYRNDYYEIMNDEDWGDE